MKSHLTSILSLAISFLILSPSTTQASSKQPFDSLTPEERSLYRTSGIVFYYCPVGATSFGTTEGEFTSSDETASVIAGFLSAAGYSDVAIAAILGNLARESGLNPAVLEKKYASNANITVDENFRAWDNGKKTYSGGFGIVQWTSAGRVQRLQEYADSKNLPVVSLEAQVGFMIQELAAYNYSPDKLNSYDLERATYEIWKKYEAPASSNGVDYASASGSESYTNRLSSANGFLGIEPSANVPSSGSSGSRDCLPADALLASSLGSTNDIVNTIIGGGGGGATAAQGLAWPLCDNNNPDPNLHCWNKNNDGVLVKVSNGNGYAKIAWEQPTDLYRQHAVGSTKNCNVFVATAMRYSGADPDFETRGVTSQENYMKNSGKYQLVNATSLSDLQPGDIMVWTGMTTSGSENGHIVIYVGDGLHASASQGTRNGALFKANIYSTYYMGRAANVYRLVR